MDYDDGWEAGYNAGLTVQRLENDRLRAALEFVRTDPCFKVLGTVTHDMVTDALGLTAILTTEGG